MVCPEYDLLTDIEKRIYTGKLIHAVQNDSRLFYVGTAIIETATKEGLFANVVFHPSETNLNLDNNEAATI